MSCTVLNEHSRNDSTFTEGRVPVAKPLRVASESPGTWKNTEP